MTQFLSAISGRFGTSLILGTLLPVTVFVTLARALLAPLLPAGSLDATFGTLATVDERWEILLLSLAVIVLSGLLYNLNVPHIRLYEGYPWAGTWIGRHRRDRWLAEVEQLSAVEKGVPALRRRLRDRIARLKAHDPTDPEIARLGRAIEAATAEQQRAAMELNLAFPRPAAVLPTRLGNVIRSAEHHPQRQYRMAAITLWPRLIAKIDPAYASALDSAKANFDFMLNGATLSGLLATALVAAGVFGPGHQAAGALRGWPLQALLFGVVAAWLYRQSVSRAQAWGNLVRGAFDLYRWDLLRQLGYVREPGTVAEERSLWKEISSRLIYGDPPAGVKKKLSPYRVGARPATSAVSREGVELHLLRAVGAPRDAGMLPVTIEVRNGDPAKQATGLTVTDTVPEGFDLILGSEATDRGEVRAVGLNPYTFHLPGSLDPGGSVRLIYRILPRPKVPQ